MKVSEIPYKVQTTNRENHQDFTVSACNSSSHFFMRIHINPLKANTEPSFSLLPTSVGQRLSLNLFIFLPYKFNLVATHYQPLRDKYSEVLSSREILEVQDCLHLTNRVGLFVCLLFIQFHVPVSCLSHSTAIRESRQGRQDTTQL